MSECPTCKGHKGSVEADFWDLNDPNNHLGWVPCPTCGPAEVVDLAAERQRRHDDEIAESMARHPAGRANRRTFRKPRTPD